MGFLDIDIDINLYGDVGFVNTKLEGLIHEDKDSK